MNLTKYLRLYFIMGSNNTDQDPLYVLEESIKGGVTMFQFREKGFGALKGQEKKQLAIKLKEICNTYSIPFIINDDVRLALEIGADGVHVGQDDASVLAVKAICPEDFIIGVSAMNETEAINAVNDGADYIGVGPIYSTATKEDAKKPIGLKGIHTIRELVGNMPIVAIGGIKSQHANNIIQAGADGISVISAISQASNPKAAAEQLAM